MQITNITKMVDELKKAGAQQGPPGPPGPQGPAGPQGPRANFAGCTHGHYEKQAAPGSSAKSDAVYVLTATVSKSFLEIEERFDALLSFRQISTMLSL